MNKQFGIIWLLLIVIGSLIILIFAGYFIVQNISLNTPSETTSNTNTTAINQPNINTVVDETIACSDDNDCSLHMSFGCAAKSWLDTDPFLLPGSTYSRDKYTCQCISGSCEEVEKNIETNTSTNTASIPIEDWKTYSNEYGYTIKYPASMPLNTSNPAEIVIGTSPTEPGPGAFTIKANINSSIGKRNTEIQTIYSQEGCEKYIETTVNSLKGLLLKCYGSFALEPHMVTILQGGDTIYDLTYIAGDRELDPIMGRILSTFTFSQNYYDMTKIQAGNQVAEMTVETVNGSNHEGSVQFSGTVTVTGTYKNYFDEQSMIQDVICLSELDNASELRIPKEINDSRDMWFCFSNSADVRDQFGADGSTGRATVTISNYKDIIVGAGVWNTASMISKQ